MISHRSCLKSFQLKPLHQIITKLSLAAFIFSSQITKTVAQLMKLECNVYSQFTSCFFHFVHVTTIATLALSNVRVAQLSWCAWMHYWWIVLNYHQVQLAAWCNTGLGIAPSSVTQNFLRFNRASSSWEQRFLFSRLQHVLKLYCMTLNIVVKIKSALLYAQKLIAIFMPGVFLPKEKWQCDDCTQNILQAGMLWLKSHWLW